MIRGHNPGRVQAIMRIRRESRRQRAMVSTEDRRDIGIRPGVVERLGLDGEREVIIDGLVVEPSRVFVALAHHWFQRAA